jgi:AcrR family transcriptional regulator
MVDEIWRAVPEPDGLVNHPRRRGRKPSPEKKVRILEAAVELFTNNDYHRVLVDDIADRAGVGKGTVYRYFPTKEALFLELVELAVSRSSEVIRAGIDSREPALTRLRRAVAMTLEYFRRNEPFLAILYHEKVFRSCREKKELDLRRTELRAVFVRLLAEGIAEGSIRGDMEPLVGAVVLMSSVRALLRNFSSQRTSEQLAEQLLSIFIDGAAARSDKRGAATVSTALRGARPVVDASTMAKLDPLAALTGAGRELPADMPEDIKNLLRYESGEFFLGSGGVQNY